MTTTTPPRAGTPTRRQLTVYALVLPALVLPIVAFAVAQGLDLDRLGEAPVAAQIAIFSMGFTPGVAGLAAWLSGGRGLRGFDWGFRRVPWRVIALAWAIPVLSFGLAYATAWLTGVADLDTGHLSHSVGGLHPVLAVALGLGPGVLPYVLLSLGEQTGWSSLLAVRLSETRSIDATALIVGLAWGLFHFPMMLFVPGAIDGDVPTPYALLCFMAETVALAYPLVWLRLRTSSIWPVLTLHATCNAALYFVLAPLTKASGLSPWLLGEGGALPSLFTALVVLATRPLWRR